MPIFLGLPFLSQCLSPQRRPSGCWEDGPSNVVPLNFLSPLSVASVPGRFSLLPSFVLQVLREAELRGPSLILSSRTPQHPSSTPDVASSGHKAHSKIFPQSQTNPSYTCHSLRDKGTGHFLPSAAGPWGMLGWTRPWSRPTTSERPLCSVTQAPALQLHMQESVTLLGPRGSSKQALSGYVGTELTYCKGSTLRPGVSDFRGDAVTRDHGRGPKPTCYEPPQVGYWQAQTFYLPQNPLSWLCPLSVPQLLHL